MRCPHCLSEIPNDSEFCLSCGRRVGGTNGQTQTSGQSSFGSNFPNHPPRINSVHSSNSVPSNYQPISSWGYVGYTVLFSLPLVGFIFLIICALSNDNINRRNFARSYFCIILLVVVAVIIFGTSLLEFLNEYSNSF